MPREQINFPDEPAVVIHPDGSQSEYLDEQDQDGIVFNDPSLHVNWSPPTDVWPPHVQVSLEFDTPVLTSRVKSLSGNEETSSLYSASLDRGELNRLIKVLRTARDRAYGRDE
ncbi:hypothetical protein [Clavibacter capsici]|uniref:hypothetical protein n=1 Tax=Clavibacter capsici TaxID=1874630 RepID=UPI0014287C0D|nr:hypothetical protein [Clavibacter capsici]QIS38621.1 hypothetical protein GW572_04400 [Clavibacter capsici]